MIDRLRRFVSPLALVAFSCAVAIASAAQSPVITSQPASRVVSAGQPATFAVVATSATAMRYQWSRNGVAIANANTATYALAATQLSDNAAAFAVTVTNANGKTTSAVARLTVNAIQSTGATADRLFSDRSPWNARPSRFTLGTDAIPTSTYYPTVAQGTWSVGGAVASNTDAPMTVLGSDGRGVWIPDAEAFVPQIVIPHWPAGVAPAPGADGHADIIDVAANRIHSFYQLRNVDGQWRATQYAWTALDGTGWGTPAQYAQGSRAVGVVPIAGIIRKGEVNDGQPMYRHALAMSLTYNALAKSPTFVFPATSADWDAATANGGTIPEGTRLMLPSDFDVARLGDPRLAKIAQTLKTFGAYVVDRNVGTPYVIYVENGSGFDLMPNGWDSAIATQLDTIRAALRPIAQVSEWVDATGAVFVPDRNLEMLSMRGAWTLMSGVNVGTFDTWDQSVSFANDGRYTVQTNYSNRSMPSVAGRIMIVGQRYRLRVHASGGATFRLQLWNGSWQYDSGTLSDGADLAFAWPVASSQPIVTIASGPSGGGKVSASVVPLP